MIWLELTLAAIGGAAVGWVAHVLFRRRADATRRSSSARPPDTIPVPQAPPAVASAETADGPSSGTRPRLSESADTAGRVIVHLASLGRLGPDDIGLSGHTQRGMTEALGIRQGTLAKVLDRLEIAEVVEVDRRHVRGEPRRLKVYRLTALGESAARDIRRRRPPATRPP